jgi:hypothetical protein
VGWALALDGHLNKIVDEAVWELDGLDELADGFKVIDVDDAQQEAEEFGGVDMRGREIGGLGGDAMQEGVEG